MYPKHTEWTALQTYELTFQNTTFLMIQSLGLTRAPPSIIMTKVNPFQLTSLSRGQLKDFLQTLVLKKEI